MALDFSRLRAISNQQEQTRFPSAAQDFADPPPPDPLDGAIELPREEAAKVGAVFACEQIKSAIKEGASNVGLLKIAFAALADISEDKAFPEECEKLIDERRSGEDLFAANAYDLQTWQDATELYYKYQHATTIEQYEAFVDECNALANRNYIGRALAATLADLLEI